MRNQSILLHKAAEALEPAAVDESDAAILRHVRDLITDCLPPEQRAISKLENAMVDAQMWQSETIGTEVKDNAKPTSTSKS